MFRRILFLSAAALALLWPSAAPGHVYAQRHRSPPGTLRPGFNPTFPSRFTPGFGSFRRGFRARFGTFGPRFGGFPFGFGGPFFAPGFNSFGPPLLFRRF